MFTQGLDRIERGRAKDMLNAVKTEIKGGYYNSAYNGVDLDARFKEAEQSLEKATSLGQAYGIIAQAVLDLNDSHTKFYPPSRTARVEYGWRMQPIGDKCFVTAVKPKSDAEAQGLKVGDEVVSVEGFRPNRKELWKINYYYNAISPRTRLALKVQSPGEREPRDLTVNSKVIPQKRIIDLEDVIRDFEINDGFKQEHRFVTIGSTIIWKMPTFVTPPEMMDEIMKGRVNKASNLILDLRGNGGGYVVTLEALAGYFVDADVKIAELKGRKEMKPQMAKTKGKNAFSGKVIVLVDSHSGSASEIFARFVQLRQRGIVIGDRSAGAVMQSRSVPMSLGVDTIVPYGMSLTNADVIMEDGSSLEHNGVTPQLVMVPTGADLAAGRDPVLAAALKLLEHDVTPEKAGSFFPFKWEEER